MPLSSVYPARSVRARTEAMRLYCKAREGDTIQYVDVMNLYPYICKYLRFRVGHPVIHVGDACKDEETCLRMDCLIKCSIVLPERMYNPMLPFRANNKLMLCLCRRCVLYSQENTAIPQMRRGA